MSNNSNKQILISLGFQETESWLFKKQIREEYNNNLYISIFIWDNGKNEFTVSIDNGKEDAEELDLFTTKNFMEVVFLFHFINNINNENKK